MEIFKKRKVYINKKKNSKANDCEYEEISKEKRGKDGTKKVENTKEKIAVEENIVDAPKKYNIPAHILGRSLTDPMNDETSGNRRLQKPRPGVKIPYRNLTSQIISNEELNREVLIRTNKRCYPFKNDPQTELQCKLYAQAMRTRLLNRLPILKNVKFQKDCLGILRMACDVQGETNKAIKELEDIPMKRRSSKSSNNITVNVDYKKVNLHEPVSAQEIALRQLAELDADKVKRGRKRKL